jgi:hypothetical protein
MKSPGSRPARLALTAFCLLLPLTSVAAESKPVPAAVAQTARVTQGGVVPLPASALTRQALLAKRPNYETLIPRVRTNKE